MLHLQCVNSINASEVNKIPASKTNLYPTKYTTLKLLAPLVQTKKLVCVSLFCNKTKIVWDAEMKGR